MRKAENCSIVRKGVIEQRPSFGRHADLDANVASNYVYSIIDYRRNTLDGQLLYHGTSLSSLTGYIWADGTTITDSASILVPPDFATADPYGLLARKNCYLPSQKKGLAKMESTTDQIPRIVGTLPLGATPTNVFATGAMTTSLEAADNWLTSTWSVYYRVVVKKTDLNGVVYRSSPSFFPIKVTNSGAARFVRISIAAGTLGSANVDLEVGDTIELYRTPSALLTTSGDYSELGTELFLAASATYDGSAIFDIDDKTPDVSLGADLYTNLAEEGDEAGNWVPPSGTTGASFRDCSWLGNLNHRALWTSRAIYFDGTTATTPPYDSFRMYEATASCGAGSTTVTLTVGSTANLRVGMRMTSPSAITLAVPDSDFASIPYVTSITNATTFTINTAPTGAGMPATTVWFRDIISFVQGSVSIDLYASTVYNKAAGFLACPNNNTPTYTGSLLASLSTWLNDPSNSNYSIYWVPKLHNSQTHYLDFVLTQYQVSSGMYQQPLLVATSAPDCVEPSFASPNYITGRQYEFFVDHIGTNEVAYSKPFEPEHFAALNYIALGREDAKVLKLVPLKESLLVFKEDGIWRINGSFPNWYVDELDRETILTNPESTCVLDNICYAWTNRGVVKVTEYQCEPLSSPVLAPDTTTVAGTSTDLLFAARQFLPGHTTPSKGAYAVSLPHRGVVCFAVPSGLSQSKASQWWVYSPLTNAWTTWQLTSRCAAYRQKSGLLMIEGGDKSQATFEVRQEKYTLDTPDYYDDSHDLGVVSITSGFTIAAASLDRWIPAVGDLMWNPTENRFAYVTAAALVGSDYVVTLSGSLAATSDQVYAYEGIRVKMRWNQQGVEGPFAPALWQEFLTEWVDLQNTVDEGARYTYRFYGAGKASLVSSDQTSYFSSRSGAVTDVASGTGQAVIDRVAIPRSVARQAVLGPEIEFTMPRCRWRLGSSLLKAKKANEGRGVRR